MRRRFTLFHVLWLTGALACALVGYFEADHFVPTEVRLAVAAFAFLIGLILSSVAVLLLVTFVIVPRLRPGSYWQSEVDSFMRTVFGNRSP